MLSQGGWSMDARLRAQVQRMAHFFGHTRIVEECFNQAADAERDAGNDSMAPVMVWRKAVDRQVLSGRNSFRELSVAEMPEATRRDGDLRARLFEPVHKKSTMSFADLPGKGAPKWTTYDPQSMSKIACSTIILAHCYANSSFDQVRNIGLAELCQRGTILCKTQRGQHWASLGVICKRIVALGPSSSSR